MKKGVFVGLIVLDIIYYHDSFPVENEKIKTHDFATAIGGPAANAAITYSLLGGEATLITCIGNTTIGKSIKDELVHDYQIEVVDLADEHDAKMNISSIFVNQQTATRTIWSGQQQFAVDEAFDYAPFFENALFCLSDCNLPEVSIPALRTAAALNVEIVLDNGNWKEHFPQCLSVAHTAIASSSCQPPNKTFYEVAREHQVDNIAITYGANPIHWYTKVAQGEIAVPEVEAVDTLGAGDVLHGAYCYFKYVEKKSFTVALQLAAQVASESVKYKGARQGVYTFISQR